MTIEIYSPNLQVSEQLTKAIEKKLGALSHLGKVSRAEVFLTIDDTLSKVNKVCKIRLDIPGDTLFVHKNGVSFENAVTTAIKIIKRLLKKATEHRNQPDEITSTIEIESGE